MSFGFSIGDFIAAIELANKIREEFIDAPIESKDENGQTLLSYAAEQWHEGIVKRLLEKSKVDVESKDENGRTLLSYAAEEWYEGIVKLLLETVEVDVESKDENGRTLLSYAASGWKTANIQLLLDKGADIESKDEDGRTPLLYATSSWKEANIQLLLEKGADVAVASNDGWTSLHAASFKGHADVIQLLLEKGADIAVASNDGWTPLYAASSNGHVEAVQLLLEKGADVTVANNDGWTPLHAASSNGHISIVHLLLKMGADVAVVTNIGWTPLHEASFKGHADVIQLLLEKGADVEAKDNVCRTPLFHAAKNGNEAAIKLLLATNRVVIDTKDYYNSTPLSIAARIGHKDIVALLLAEGHALNIKDDFGRTPLWWAKRNGYPEIVNLLLQKCKEGGINVEEEDLPPTLILAPSDEPIKICDACVLGISKKDTSNHCGVCNNGDFDICNGCIAMEARCLDESHELVKEVNRKQIVYGAALKHPEEIPLGQSGQDKTKITDHNKSRDSKYATEYPDQRGEESNTSSSSDIGQHHQRKLKLSSFSFWLMSRLNPPPPDCHRITYTCGCGDDLYLDVKELSHGGIERFKQRLLDAASTIRRRAQGSEDRTSLPGPPPPAHLSSSTQAPLSSTGPQGRRLNHLLSRQSAPQSIETQTQTPALTRNLRYVLLCVNTKRLKALTQVEVGSIENDEYLFRDIRDAYMQIRRPNEWKFSVLLPSFPRWILARFPTWLSAWSEFKAWLGDTSIHVPRTADFVRFQLIPVRAELCPAYIKKPSFPPEDEVRARRYLYFPCPMDVEIHHVPFLHELLKPGAHLGDYWLTLLPKKLQDPLEWTRERAVIGWGIQINEGINWKVILAFMLLCLILTGLCVGLYAAIRGDVSSAAGLGAYLVAVIAVVVQLQYYAWVDG